MNKQSLSTLTLEQLYQHQEVLAKRIDDLKFFNLDLGRENIRLAEQYRVARDHAEKIKQGKTHKLRRAKNFTKNVYIHQQPRYSHIQRVQKSKNDSKNGFNFNDIYKVGKSKLTGWWGGSGDKKRQSENVNQPMQSYYGGNDNYSREGEFPANNVMIVVDCPPAQVIKQPQINEIDPLQQPITQIIKQPPHQLSEQQKYERLYHDNDHERYIREVQQEMVIGSSMQRNNQYYSTQQDHANIRQNQTQKLYHYDPEKVYHYDEKTNMKIKGQDKKQTNGKTFEFDDLPGLGWKKLKGLIGFGSKSKKNNKYTPQQPSTQLPTYQQQNYHNTYQQYQQEENTNQKKRTPIFGHSQLYPREQYQQKHEFSERHNREQGQKKQGL